MTGQGREGSGPSPPGKTETEDWISGKASSHVVMTRARAEETGCRPGTGAHFPWERQLGAREWRAGRVPDLCRPPRAGGHSWTLLGIERASACGRMQLTMVIAILSLTIPIK